jgi:cell division protease FtsH
VFLGRDISHQKDYSEETAREIDEEVRRIVNEAYEKAVAIVRQNHEALDRVAEALLLYETIDGDELQELIEGRALTRQPPKKSPEPNTFSDAPSATPATPQDETVLEAEKIGEEVDLQPHPPKNGGSDA